MEIYKENIVKHNREIDRLTRVLSRVSMLRLLVFIDTVGVISFYINANNITSIFVVIPIVLLCFAVISKYHNKISYQK